MAVSPTVAAMSDIRPSSLGRAARAAGIAVWIVLVFWLSAGCGERKPEGAGAEAMPPAVSDAEVERGTQGCAAYAARVCACAKARPDSTQLAEMCELAPAKASSLDMVLRVNRSPKGPEERVRTGNTARRIMASCLSAGGELDSLGCPRPE